MIGTRKSIGNRKIPMFRKPLQPLQDETVIPLRTGFLLARCFVPCTCASVNPFPKWVSLRALNSAVISTVNPRFISTWLQRVIQYQQPTDETAYIHPCFVRPEVIDLYP